MRLFKKALLALSALLIMCGCTTPAEKGPKVIKKEAGEEIHQRFTLKPGGSYEECVELGPGMIFDYHYRASDFVNFNIHYHGEDEVHYPVARKGYMRGSGTIDPGMHKFHSDEQEFYCMMWENPGSEKVNVEYACNVRKKGMMHH